MYLADLPKQVASYKKLASVESIEPAAPKDLSA